MKRIYQILLVAGLLLSLWLNVNPPKTAYAITDSEYKNLVKQYITLSALAHGVDPKLAIFIVEHESNFDPGRIGDDGISIGAWQINIKAHPTISKIQAENLKWSTNWAMGQLKAGNAKIWSTYRFCHKLYNHCPYDSEN